MSRMSDNESYWYLASLYTGWEGGKLADPVAEAARLDRAWKFACTQAAILIDAGVPVYGPIAMTHPIAEAAAHDGSGEKAHLNYDKWLELDAVFLRHAQGIIIVKSPGWEASRGIFAEKVAMWTMGKPVVYMTPGKVPEEVR